MEFHMINITYAAMHMLAETEKTTFSCKDDCTLTKHTRRWTYSALRHFFIPLNQSLNFSHLNSPKRQTNGRFPTHYLHHCQSPPYCPPNKTTYQQAQLTITESHTRYWTIIINICINNQALYSCARNLNDSMIQLQILCREWHHLTNRVD